MSYRYKNSVLGGTFDHFHKGHRLFIEEAFRVSEKVTIGISDKNLTRNKILAEQIESYDLRRKSVEEYLKEKGYIKRAKVIPIKDFYGNTLQEQEIDAIFTDIKNSDKITLINEKRKEIGFGEIKLVNVPLVLDSEGNEISSTRIRQGKINSRGIVFLKLFEKTLFLPKELRQELRMPFGKVVKNIDVKSIKDATKIIAVGDVVVSDLVKISIIPHLSIYDLHTKKLKIKDSEILNNLPEATTYINNEPGTINPLAVLKIEEILDSGDDKVIKIIGEEDLLALPSILLAPLGSVVIYGLRDKGAVVVEVTLDLKTRIVEKFISKFTS